jgi:hypothetical protein
MAKLPTPIDPKALEHAKKMLCSITTDYLAGLPHNADIAGDADMCFSVPYKITHAIDYYRAFAHYRDVLKHEYHIKTTYQSPREYLQQYHSIVLSDYTHYNDKFCTDSHYAEKIYKHVLKCSFI